MLEILESFDGTETGARAMCEALSAHRKAVMASRGRGDRRMVARAEAEVSGDPAAAIRFDGEGFARVHAAGHTWQGGRFETSRVSELLARARAQREQLPSQRPGLRLMAVAGVDPSTDIGALQATAPPDSLFQVASQFNCLEAPSPQVVPVAAYFSGPTQGPRASISAFPGTLVRHYSAPAQPEAASFSLRVALNSTC